MYCIEWKQNTEQTKGWVFAGNISVHKYIIYMLMPMGLITVYVTYRRIFLVCPVPREWYSVTICALYPFGWF